MNTQTRLVDVQVSLTVTEWGIAKEIVGLRNNSHKNLDDDEFRVGDVDRKRVDEYAAELAYCKMLNLYPDYSIQAVKGNHWDAVYMGARVDVKQTSIESGRMLVKDKNSGLPWVPAPDFFAFMVGTGNWYGFRGYMSAADVFGHELTYQINGKKLSKPCWAIEQGDLREDIYND